MSKDIRNKIGALASHLLDVIDLIQSPDFDNKTAEEKALILDKARAVQRNADTITKLAAVELQHRAIDLEVARLKKQPVNINLPSAEKLKIGSDAS